MYCPSCGTELTQELIYCNRCGANLKPLSNQSAIPPTRLVGMGWAISVAIALVTLGGFGMIFALVLAVITRGIGISAGGMVLIFLSLLVILAVAWLLVRQLSRVLDIAQLVGDTSEAKKPKLEQKPMQQIGASPQPVSSVTENTTRTFEPMHRQQETQR